jgi:tRNA dimethylallyltransferase
LNQELFIFAKNIACWLLEYMTENKVLIALAGPTGSGKTALAIRLAETLGADIISADSRQIYREMRIGTARPNDEQMNRIQHYFIGNVSIRDNYNAGRYESEVLDFLTKYYRDKNIAILCGGTGLYLEAVLTGLDEFPDIDEAISASVQSDMQSKGLKFLQEELKQMDPAYHMRVDLNNPHRVMRAVAVIRQSGIAFSDFLQKKKERRTFSIIRLAIDLPRAVLYERINARVDVMIENGLIEEARQLYGYRNYKALQTVGYKELFEHFGGLITLDEAIELIKRNTRRYAKRQLTWFRNKGNWISIDPKDEQRIMELIISKISVN